MGSSLHFHSSYFSFFFPTLTYQRDILEYTSKAPFTMNSPIWQQRRTFQSEEGQRQQKKAILADVALLSLVSQAFQDKSANEGILLNHDTGTMQTDDSKAGKDLINIVKLRRACLHTYKYQRQLYNLLLFEKIFIPRNGETSFLAHHIQSYHLLLYETVFISQKGETSFLAKKRPEGPVSGRRARCTGLSAPSGVLRAPLLTVISVLTKPGQTLFTRNDGNSFARSLV